MNVKKMSVGFLGLAALPGCSFQQGADTAAHAVVANQDVIDTAVQATGIPFAGLIVKGLGAVAAGYLTYKAGLHKPVLAAGSNAVGAVGDVLSTLSGAATKSVADACQHVEDTLKPKA